MWSVSVWGVCWDSEHSYGRSFYWTFLCVFLAWVLWDGLSRNPCCQADGSAPYQQVTLGSSVCKNLRTQATSWAQLHPNLLFKPLVQRSVFWSIKCTQCFLEEYQHAKKGLSAVTNQLSRSFSLLLGAIIPDNPTIPRFYETGASGASLCEPPKAAYSTKLPFPLQNQDRSHWM